MKKMTVLLLVTAFMLILSTAVFAADDTIKLGVAGPHSGDLAPYGIPAMKATQLVVKEINAKGGILGRWVGRIARVPHIVHTPHGHVLYGYAKGFKNWVYLIAERATAPLTDRLVALSRGEMRESIEHGIGRADQWVVIPSGVPLKEPSGKALAAEEESGSSTIKIGTVARLEHVKGIDLLVRAAAHMANNMVLSVISWRFPRAPFLWAAHRANLDANP